MGDEGGEELDPYVKYIEDFYEDVARKDYSGLEGHTQREPAKPWSDEGDPLIVIPVPEYPETIQIYPENNSEQPLNVDIRTLKYLLNVDLDMLPLYKYLYKYPITEGSQQPVGEAAPIFNKEIRIPLNGGSDAEHTFNLYNQTEHQGGTVRAIYGPEKSRLEQIINELEEIERGLKEYGIDVDKRTGRIVISGVPLSPTEVRSILEAAESYQLLGGEHPTSVGSWEERKLPQPCIDIFGENALTQGIKGYKVIEVEMLKYPGIGNVFEVEATRNLH